VNNKLSQKYDLEFEQRDTKLLKALLWTIFGSTIIASKQSLQKGFCLILKVFLNVFTLLERIEYLKAKKLLESSANLKNTGGLWLLLIETFTLLLQPYPFTRGKIFSQLKRSSKLDRYKN